MGKLTLPIYIEIDSNASCSRISGKLENQVICNILKIKDCSEKYLYRKDIKLLRKELTTTHNIYF